jgi:hypothetical protein
MQGEKMNKQDREKLQQLSDELSYIQESEQEKYDNAPENLQNTERIEKFQENADSIQEAIDILSHVLED